MDAGGRAKPGAFAEKGEDEGLCFILICDRRAATLNALDITKKVVERPHVSLSYLIFLSG